MKISARIIQIGLSFIGGVVALLVIVGWIALAVYSPTVWISIVVLIVAGGVFAVGARIGIAVGQDVRRWIRERKENQARKP